MAIIFVSNIVINIKEKVYESFCESKTTISISLDNHFS